MGAGRNPSSVTQVCLLCAAPGDKRAVNCNVRCRMSFEETASLAVGVLALLHTSTLMLDRGRCSNLRVKDGGWRYEQQKRPMPHQVKVEKLLDDCAWKDKVTLQVAARIDTLMSEDEK